MNIRDPCASYIEYVWSASRQREISPLLTAFLSEIIDVINVKERRKS